MNYPSIIGLIIGFLAIVFILSFKNRIVNPYGQSLWRSVLLFFAIYIFLLIYVAIRWNYLEHQLDTFDLNGNGNIEMEEYTNEYMIARESLTSDTARTFAFLTGALFSAIISSLFLIIDFTRIFLSIKKSENITTQ